MILDSKQQEEAMKLLKQSSMFHACHDEALRKVSFVTALTQERFVQKYMDGAPLPK
jgi:hypothetical protein